MPPTPRSALFVLLAAALLVGVIAGAFALTPPAARAGRLAGISGAGTSGIQVVNLSPTSTMTAVLDLYRQSGAAPIPIMRSGIAPHGAGASIYLPAEPSLPNGGYAGILSSDRPHAVIARTDWQNTGGAVMVEGATAADGTFVPVVFKGYAGQTSMVNIQNMRTNGMMTVDVELRASGSPEVVASQRFNIGPGTSTTLDLAKHPGFQSLPQGFVGTMEVAPTMWDGPGWPIAVSSIVDIETSPRAVYAFGGDSGDAEAVFVPRFRVQDPAYDVLVPAKHTTLLAVANPGTAAAGFRVTYTGTGGSCAGQVVVHGDRSFSIPAGSNLLFDPGPAGAGLATGSSGLPSGCFGTAKIEVVADPSAPGAAARVAAVVVDIQRDTDGQATGAGAYNAFPRADASTTVLSPMFRNWVFGMSTELTVMNLGASPAQVELRLKRDPDDTPVTDCGDACRAVIPPNVGHTFRAEEILPLAIGMIGSATIVSDQPIVAIVDDLARGAPFDSSTFRAINATLPSELPQRSHSAVPLLLQRSGGNPTAPRPTPVDGPGVDIYAIGFVDVFGGEDPSCPGCDGHYSAEDELHAVNHPLPPMTFVLRDDQGRELARTTSEPLATIQRGLLHAPELADGRFYTLELIGDPQGYRLCGNEPRARRLDPDDFQLDSTRQDFHFNDNLCIPDPNITPIPTRTPGPSATPWPPGTPDDTIFAIGFVDVFGGLEQGCPGCDGEYQPEDEAYASEHPLPPMTFVVKDKDGIEIARAESEGLVGLQRAMIEVPSLVDGEVYTLELVESPADWALCTNEPRVRRLEPDDFQLGTARHDFHFNRGQCMPWPTATVPIRTLAHRYGPSDDSRVGSASANSNYGDSTYLRVRQAEGDDHRSYLRFEVDDLEGPIVNAKLRLFAYDGSGDRGAAHVVATNWTEGTLTWNNAPALGARLGAAGTAVANEWVEYDVTSVMHPGDGTYAFAIVGNAQDSLYFRSKEYASHHPELLIETAGEAPPPATPASPMAAGPKGVANAGVMLINLDPESPRNLQLVARRQGGGGPMRIDRMSVSPISQASVYLPAEQSLVSGVFSGLISGDGPLAAIANTRGSSPSQPASAYHEEAVPAADVVVPFVVKGVGGQNTLVAIQNHDTESATDVEVELIDADGQAVATITRGVAPGASITLDIGRDPELQDVPLGFAGTLRARAALRIAAQAFVDVEHSPMALYGFQGEPAVAVAGTLFVPRVHAGVPVDPSKPAAGLRMTRIAVANPGAAAVQVKLTFSGLQGPCAGQTTAPPTAPVSIAAGGMRVLDVPGGALPAACSAAARVDASGGGVLAVAVDTVEAGPYVRTAGAYNAFRSTQAGTLTVLPMVRKRMLDERYSTDITVMNVSSSPATVHLRFGEFSLRLPGRSYPIDCPEDCAATVAPGASYTFVPEAIAAWPEGSYGLGQAVVESDQPVVVTVTDDSRLLKSDMAIYRAAAAPLSPSDLAPPALAVPVLANRAQIRLDGPALTPPDPGWINLPSLVEPLHTLFLPIVGFLLDEPDHR